MPTAFIGLSSGLSWLAWAAGAPVVMISGFTHPINEFPTPYRVINWHVCNSCWNDDTTDFNNQDRADFLWCPRHKDTPRMFECIARDYRAAGYQHHQAGSGASPAIADARRVMAGRRKPVTG